MEILRKDNGNKGEFYILENKIQEAMMSYIWVGRDKIIIDHTEVNEPLKGKNAGKQMVLKAVEFAREKGIKIIPLCPFAKSIFKKNPDIRDVL
ncbi:GNAT family N-acetyltransferase [Aquiflexum lacus]|uniref:GNAT family N-acetyltransferase n=1 Tax=Aquiflexum lacus TaxID=2483805 RepID=UPI0018936F11|nr:GNAT family N-acetyltransferase [Aquiflexum lacus]